MRFIHCDERQAHAAERAADRRLEAFWRRVHQLVGAAPQGVDAARALHRIQGGVQIGRADAQLAQSIDLILHQGDERGDHERRSAEEASRKLIGERLAGSGRHHSDTVATREHGLDDGLLTRAERIVPERRLEGRARRSFRRALRWGLAKPVGDGSEHAHLLGPERARLRAIERAQASEPLDACRPKRHIGPVPGRPRASELLDVAGELFTGHWRVAPYASGRDAGIA